MIRVAQQARSREVVDVHERRYRSTTFPREIGLDVFVEAHVLLELRHTHLEVISYAALEVVRARLG